MFAATAKLKNGKTSVRLVHSFRKDGRSKKKIIKTLGQSKGPEDIKHFKDSGLEPEKGIGKKRCFCPFLFRLP